MGLLSSQSLLEIIWFLFQKEHTLYFTGLFYTVLIALVGTMLGLLLSIFLTLMRLLENEAKDSALLKVLKWFTRNMGNTYVQFFRGSPLIVQAMIFYYGLASLGVQLNLIVAGIIIVTLNSAAYLSEVLRAGINSIDKGQMDAALSIGMTKWQGYRHIIFPQVLNNMIPAIGNELVINIKDTAVLSVIGVGELFYMGRSVAGTYYRYTESFLIVALLYLVVVLITTRLLDYLVKKVSSEKENCTVCSE
jgi:putative lysine transport system permease protein